MKKRISFFLAFVMLLSLLTGCGGGQKPATSPANPATTETKKEEAKTDATAEARVFRLATQNPETNPTTIVMREFARMVEEKSNGTMKIEIYPDAQLGSEENVMQQVLTGTLDMAPISSPVLGNVVPEAGIFAFPFLFYNFDVVTSVCKDAEFKEELFSAIMEQTGCQALSFTQATGRGVSSTKRPIRTASDLEGLKIRTMGSPILVDTFNELGATSTSVAWKEVYTALQQGMIDGEDSTILANMEMGFIDYNKYFTELDEFFQNLILIVSPGTWSSLTAEQQQILIDCGAAADDFGFNLSYEKKLEAVEKCKKEHPDFVIIDDLTPEEKATFVDKVAPVWDKYKESVNVEFFEFAKGISQKYYDELIG